MRVLLMIGDGPAPAAAVTIDALAAAYYVLLDAGAEVVLASRAGGAPDILRHGSGPAAARFRADEAARDGLAETLRYDQLCLDDFDAVLCLHGDAGLAAAAVRRGVPVAQLGDLPGGAGPGLSGLLIVGGGDGDAVRAARAILAAATSPR